MSEQFFILIKQRDGTVLTSEGAQVPIYDRQTAANILKGFKDRGIDRDDPAISLFTFDQGDEITLEKMTEANVEQES